MTQIISNMESSWTSVITHEDMLGLIPSHWRPPQIRLLVDQLVCEPQMSPEKSPSQAQPTHRDQQNHPANPQLSPPRKYPLWSGSKGKVGRPVRRILQCALLTAPKLPIDANLTQRETTRHYAASEVMQQGVHSTTYEVVFPNNRRCSDQASRSNY